MLRRFDWRVFAVASILLTSCAATPWAEDPTRITINHDPSESTSDDVAEEAATRCEAYGKSAVYEDTTIDPSGRLQHSHFRCE